MIYGKMLLQLKFVKARKIISFNNEELLDSKQNASLITGLCPQFYYQHPGPTTKALGTAAVS